LLFHAAKINQPARRPNYLPVNRRTDDQPQDWRHDSTNQEITMTRLSMNRFLRGALVADAIASGAMGVLLSALPATLAQLLALPEPLLRYAGAFLVVYAAFVGWLAARERPHALLVWAVIIGNAIWVIDSLLLAASGWVHPSALGYAFVLAQAVAVGVFAELQFIGVRKAGTPSLAVN
jgi:hypothetical protein